MEGANTATLYVKNLILGNHQYQLTVTDSSGQIAADTVSVIVLSEDNKPPVANAGRDMTVVSPVSSVVLSAVGSSDDYLISSFKWTQLEWVQYLHVHVIVCSLVCVSMYSSSE